MDWSRVEHDRMGTAYVPLQEAERAVADATRATHELSSWFHWDAMWIALGVILVFIVVITVLGVFFTVEQQTAKIIERFGKFRRTAFAGLHIKIPLVDKVVDEVNLRVQQLALEVDTKTLDNVFVQIKVAIQYAALPDKVYEASYALDDEEEQITSYVFDIIRGRVPKLKLDDVFEQKDEISDGVQADLNEKMAIYGYKIYHAPVTDIIPDQRVREAMNEINANQRLRVAAVEKGEADKTIVVKRAEADKQSDILVGEGIAGKRKAIIEGLRESVDEFKSALPDANIQEIMQMILLTQYFDMVKAIGTNQGSSHTVLVPHSPGGMHEMADQVRLALLTASKP